MTSEERRERRYLRRKAARYEKRRRRLAEYDNFERLCKPSALFNAAKQSAKTIRWKSPVQKFFMSYLRRVLELNSKLLAGENVTMGFIEFDICERGKARHIKSVHFMERVVQRSLCDNALIPALTPTLIYDNGASQKGKGVSFAQKRLKEHLHRHYRKHGNEGYILLMDFSKYFDNILHEPIYEMLDKTFEDKRIVELCRMFIEPFGEKSLGIGSQVSQILAVEYRNPIDHFLKEVMRAENYACYMDDSYIISESKEFLNRCLVGIKAICGTLGITLNMKKTQIVKLFHGFAYMKGRYYLTKTGKVIAKPCKANTVRERRKLKKFKHFVDKGAMSTDEIARSYNSYRGFIRDNFNSHRTLRSMDKLFHELYGYDVAINRKEMF